jgi:Uma2 family endonuclease
MALDFEQRRFTVEEYLRMAESGIFAPDERVELLDGVVVSMPPAGPEHASVVNELFALLLKRIGDRVTLRSQSGVKLGLRSMPEPDIGVFVRVEGRYRERHPEDRDALALIEVSRSRLAYDRGPKLRLYARMRVPEYWIIDLVGKRLEIYRHPTDVGFDVRESLSPGDSVEFLAVPGEVFAVSELLRPEA